MGSRVPGHIRHAMMSHDVVRHGTARHPILNLQIIVRLQ